MITSKQIKSARITLGWSQKKLADRSGTALADIELFESSNNTSVDHVGFIQAIESALEDGGIEFINGDIQGLGIRPSAKLIKERSCSLPIEPHHIAIESEIEKLRGRIRENLRSAFRHLRLAWQLHYVDNEMSLFRAITAEEEAATALILALKFSNYPGASLMNHRNHIHKSCIVPFLNVIYKFFGENSPIKPIVLLGNGKNAKIKVKFDTNLRNESGESIFGEPDHPFNFSVIQDKIGKIYDFKSDFEEYAINNGVVNLKTYLNEEANLRNRLLYASDEGVPVVAFNDDLILHRRDNVYRICLITIGILQTPKQQLFAAQALESLLKVLDKTMVDSLDYESLSRPQGQYISAIQQPDGSFKSGIGYRTKFNITIKMLSQIHISHDGSNFRIIYNW